MRTGAIQPYSSPLRVDRQSITSAGGSVKRARFPSGAARVHENLCGAGAPAAVRSERLRRPMAAARGGGTDGSMPPVPPALVLVRLKRQLWGNEQRWRLFGQTLDAANQRCDKDDGCQPEADTQQGETTPLVCPLRERKGGEEFVKEDVQQEGHAQ